MFNCASVIHETDIVLQLLESVKCSLDKGLYCTWSATNTHPQSILLNTVFVCTRKVRGLTRGACRGKYIVDYFLETITETSAKHFITKTVQKTQVPFNNYKLSQSSVFIYHNMITVTF